jgi:hypothetical protein
MGDNANLPKPEGDPPSPQGEEAGCSAAPGDHAQAIAAQQPGGGGAPGTGDPDFGGGE